MPPALHPRSRMTTTLFTSTLLFSFLIVSTPHLLPCPVEPVAYADSADPTNPRRRRRRKVTAEGESASAASCSTEDIETLKRKRECPVPKPGGLMGQILGFRKEEKEGRELPIVVKVEPVRRMRRKEDDRDP